VVGLVEAAKKRDGQDKAGPADNVGEGSGVGG